MAPTKSAQYAELYDTYVADDGKTYIAKMVSGEMTWVILPCGHSQEPKVPATVMDQGDILIGEDKQEYIVTMSKGSKVWLLNSKKKDKNSNNKHNIDRTASKLPLVPADVLDIGDIQVSHDGTEYIVKLVNGNKQYILHQKSYKWSKTGVMYTTLESGDSESYQRSSSKMKSSSKKKVNT